VFADQVFNSFDIVARRRFELGDARNVGITETGGDIPQ
jgi:hypothetical protein